MEYTLVDGKVTVVQERTIKVGHICRMNSSAGMAGILDGDVVVRQVKLPQDMTEQERNWTVDSWDHYEPDEEGYDEYMNMICNEPWVQYEYSRKDVIPTEKLAWLPLEEFLSHKSQY